MDIKAIDHNVNALAMEKNGKRYGMCVAWATQISADHILCAVGGQSSTGNVIEEGDIVGFSNLANGQQMVCFTLGDMKKHSDTIDKLANILCTEDEGAILIDGARTAIKCRVIKRVKIEGVDTANMICLEMLSGKENDVPALHIEDLGGMQMLLDFNSMQEITCPGMNDGTGTMSSRMYVDAENRMVFCRIHPGSSIGMHTQKGSSDINYVISGHGKAICDGEEEILLPRTCHYCRNGQAHSIINDGDEDLVIFTVVSKVAEV